MPYATALEYALHSLLHLADLPAGATVRARDLARFQGLPETYLAKVLQQLKKAGLVQGTRGPRGGFRLARPLHEISFWDVTEAVEGRSPLFDCQEVRVGCVLYRDHPEWVPRGRCEIHQVMLEVEGELRRALDARSLGSVRERIERKQGSEQRAAARAWFAPGEAPEPAPPAGSEAPSGHAPVPISRGSGRRSPPARRRA